MVKRFVRVYIEGGGVGQRSDSDFRRCWGIFLTELRDLAQKSGYVSLKIVRGKGRARTFESFKNYKKTCPNDLCVLLVDSETTVKENEDVWSVVAHRPQDRWQRPDWATERHLYLMVPFVETWIITDINSLKRVFGNGFNPRALPTTNLENRSKQEINDALAQATQGRYTHGQSHEIIEIVDPEKVKVLRYGRRLFEGLGSLIRDERIV